MTPQVFYYLFGDYACRRYYESGSDEPIQSIADRISKEEFGLFRYSDSEHNPSDLLDAFNGWMEYAEISQDLYLAIQKTMTS